MKELKIFRKFLNENLETLEESQKITEGHSLSDDDINYLEAFINMPANEDNVILRRIIKNIIKTNIKS